MVVIDPLQNYCTYCDYTWKFSKLELLLMFLGVRNTYTCRQCGAVMEYRLVYHTAKVDSKKTRDRRIWENG